jgi:hypothetical protein
MKKKNVNPNVIQSHTQVQAIKKHLLKGKKINALEALQEFQCMRLGARIWDLQAEPHNLPIEKKMITVEPSGKRVVEYRLDRDYLKRYREQKRKK